MPTFEQRALSSKTKPIDNLRWLHQKVGMYRRRGGKAVPKDAFNVHRGGIFIGGMFVYKYDPKTKETLPWWDALPVVIPIEMYDDGWLGLNLHYIPPRMRIKLMEKLLSFKQRAGSDKAYMRLSYDFLRGALESKLFDPCIKRYLASHLETPLIRVDDEHWEKVAMLPIQEFRYANAQKVWANPSGYPKKRKRRR